MRTKLAIATLASDLRHEIRALRRMPAFAAIVLFVMALGIGATVAIFSVVNAVLLRSLPYGHPEKLAYVWTPNSNFKGLPDEMGPSVPDFYDWQRLNRSFSSMAAFTSASLGFVQNGATQSIGAAFVTAHFFQTLDVHPALGRALDANDDQPGHELVAVVSHRFSQSQPNILGSQIQLNRKRYTVVGIMPKDFGYPFDGDVPYYRSGFPQTDIWLPAAYTAKQKSNRDNFAGAIVIGRLRNGVSAAAAQADLKIIEAQLQPLWPLARRGWTTAVKLLVPSILGPVQEMLWLLFGVVALVLLIAIGNVTGLLLARMATRAHELGIRTALGAQRARIIRQLLTESLLLNCTGGVMGIALAYALVRLLIAINPGGIPRFDSATVDLPVLAIAVALSVFAGLVSGIWPAISASAPSVNDLLKRTGTRIAIGSHHGRSALIVLEVALSVVLLTGSGILIRSYLQLQAVNLGFSPSSLTVTPNLDERYNTAEARTAFQTRFLQALQTLPGLQHVGATNALPLSDEEGLASAEIKGYGKSLEFIEIGAVTLDYQKALGTFVLLGRDFEPQDLNPKSNVILVNKKFADVYFHHRDPLGGQVRIGLEDISNNTWLTIVGVVDDVRQSAVDQPGKPQIYQPAQAGDTFVLRSSLPVQALAAQVRASLRSLDPALTLDLKTMRERVALSNARRTFQTSLLTGFAAIAVALALVGIYGLLSFTVKQRTPEIGIRLALGSSRHRILSLIVSHGMRLTVYGLLLGLAASFALTRLINSWLYGVQATDPITFALVPVFVLIVACAACLIPAFSATRIDPIATLRQE